MARKTDDQSTIESKKQSRASTGDATVKRSAARPEASKAAGKSARPAANDRIDATAGLKAPTRVNKSKPVVGSRGSTARRKKVSTSAKPPAKPGQTPAARSATRPTASNKAPANSRPSTTKGATSGRRTDTAAARKTAVNNLVPKDPWYGVIFRAKDKERLQDVLLGGVLLPILVDIATRGGLLGFFTPLQSKLEKAHDQFRRRLLEPGKRALTPTQHLAVLQDHLYVQQLLVLTLTCVKDNESVWRSHAALERFSEVALDCYHRDHQRAETADRLSSLAEKITLEQAVPDLGSPTPRRPVL